MEGWRSIAWAAYGRREDEEDVWETGEGQEDEEGGRRNIPSIRHCVYVWEWSGRRGAETRCRES